MDLDALSTCNVGKSVNHLRNHKNQAILGIIGGLIGSLFNYLLDKILKSL